MKFIAALILFGAVQQEDPPEKLFPFVLPWDDASAGITHAGGLTPRGMGQVTAGKDGHLYRDGRRIRFFGVNLCFGGCFPHPDVADRIAARMEKFGINIVRFHHMDNSVFPRGIRKRGARSTSELDPEALERLDVFIAALKKHGIHVNLNLLVSRPFKASDGLPGEIERLSWKDRQVPAFFFEPMIELQKDFARRLLEHVNSRTGLSYAKDPVVAFVEIINESGLIHGWLGGKLDALPKPFADDLKRRWNAWLVKRHGTTARLKAAWKVVDEPLGAELLGGEGWNLERHEGAEASVEQSGGTFRVRVTRPGKAGWHVQLCRPGLKLEKGRLYTFSFRARSQTGIPLRVSVGEAHAQWRNLGLSRECRLSGEWAPFKMTFSPVRSDDNARVSFSDLGSRACVCELSDVSLRPGGLFGWTRGVRLEEGTVAPLAQSEGTAEARREWVRFLWETEREYYRTMNRFLKEELGVRGLVMGTIVGCSPPNLMAELDAVDTHAYWQHPRFPGRPWDPGNWHVENRTMVNERGGTLPGLALRRVAGKPHGVSEYNHPAPNTFSAETYLLLAAYGALQDWDALYAFTYSHRQNDWDLRRIPNFFDIDQHPLKMATLIPAAAIFSRADVRPAEKLVAAGMGPEREIELLTGARAWRLVSAGDAGVTPETALVHRVAIASSGTPAKAGPFGDVLRSDTGELTWDLSRRGRGVVTINAPKSRVVVGYAGGRRWELGNVTIEPGETLQDGWCAITLTAVTGELKPGAARLLVTATGYAENTEMGWKNERKSTVGRDWGKAPSLVEGIPARLTLPFEASRVRAWPLDARGGRREALTVSKDARGGAVLEIGPRSRTLWYEIEAK